MEVANVADTQPYEGVWKTISIVSITVAISSGSLWVTIGRDMMNREEVIAQISQERKAINQQFAAERTAMMAVVGANTTVIARLENSVERVNTSIVSWLQSAHETRVRVEGVERLQRERIEKLDRILERQGSVKRTE